MKVAYISSTGFADTDFSIIQEMKKKVDLYYFIIINTNTLKSTAINIQNQYPISGIFKTNIYPQIKKYSDFINIEKTYIVNVSNNRIKKAFVFIKLFFFLLRLNIDILHITFYSPTTFLFYFLHKKIFLTVHDPIPHSDVYSKKDIIYRKIAFNLINNFIIFNNNQKDEFISQYKLKNKNIYVSKLGICVYLSMYTNNVLQKIKDDYILFFGRITAYKGLDFLFPAMKDIHNIYKHVKLIVAGYCQDYYFNISEYLNCSYIEIINKFIPDNELAMLIQNALFVVCPYTDATQSGVVMSAFAFNIPVLATNVGGLSEYVEHLKSGYIIPPKNINELSNGIKYLLDHKELLNEQKKYINNRYKVGDYSWDKITNDFITFYNTSL